MQCDDSVVMEFYCRGGIDGFYRLVTLVDFPPRRRDADASDATVAVFGGEGVIIVLIVIIGFIGFIGFITFIGEFWTNFLVQNRSGSREVFR